METKGTPTPPSPAETIAPLNTPSYYTMKLPDWCERWSALHDEPLEVHVRIGSGDEEFIWGTTVDYDDFTVLHVTKGNGLPSMVRDITVPKPEAIIIDLTGDSDVGGDDEETPADMRDAYPATKSRKRIRPSHETMTARKLRFKHTK